MNKKGDNVDRFWDMLDRSVIVQALITLGLVGAVIYLSVTSQVIPDLLGHLTGLVIGYYFGSKVQIEASRRANQAKKK